MTPVVTATPEVVRPVVGDKDTPCYRGFRLVLGFWLIGFLAIAHINRWARCD